MSKHSDKRLNPSELGMTMDQYLALIEVRDALEGGTLPGEFDMSIPYEKTKCGTAACIGGWMYVFENDGEIDEWGMGQYVNEHSGLFHNGERRNPTLLHPLFFPPTGVAYESITESQAVEAIDSFLETGNPKWQLPADDRDCTSWEDL